LMGLSEKSLVSTKPWTR